MQPMKVEIDGKVFTSRQSWHFFFVDNMIKVLFPFCTSKLACLVPAKEKMSTRQTKNYNILHCSNILLSYVSQLTFVENFFSLKQENLSSQKLILKMKPIKYSQLLSFSLFQAYSKTEE